MACADAWLAVIAAAERTTGVPKTFVSSVPPANGFGSSIQRLEQLTNGIPSTRETTLQKIQSAFEQAGVKFIDENGGGPGVRLKKRQTSKRG